MRHAFRAALERRFILAVLLIAGGVLPLAAQAQPTADQVLNDAGFSSDDKQRVLNGMLAILIDPARLGTAPAFQSEARQFLDWLRKGRVAPGADKVRIAGEPERETRAKREREGIYVDDNTWKEILGAAAKVKLAADKVESLARS